MLHSNSIIFPFIPFAVACYLNIASISPILDFQNATSKHELNSIQFLGEYLKCCYECMNPFMTDGGKNRRNKYMNTWNGKWHSNKKKDTTSQFHVICSERWCSLNAIHIYSIHLIKLYRKRNAMRGCYGYVFLGVRNAEAIFMPFWIGHWHFWSLKRDHDIWTNLFSHFHLGNFTNINHRWEVAAVRAVWGGWLGGRGSIMEMWIEFIIQWCKTNVSMYM